MIEHIEMLGPPGVGKSTIHNEMTKSNDIMGGLDDQKAILRSIAGQESRLIEYIGNIASIYPSDIQKKLLENG